VNEQTGLSSRQRLALIAAAIVVLVAGYLLIQGSADDDGDKEATTSTPSAAGSTSTQDKGTTKTPAAPEVPVVRVVDGKPQGGVEKLSFDKGDRIRFKVVSDTADEIHVHGYDLMKDVAKGGTVSFSFEASIDGRFVVELEHHEQQIAELDVAP
jgi:hypothetical protein